jgi:membrane-bound serine protease (ClpP class)
MNDQVLIVAAILGVGLVLVALEVFVIPGLGVTAILGALALLAGSVLSWLWFGAAAGAAALLVSVLGPALLVLVFAKSSAGKKLVLDSSLPASPSAADAVLAIGAEGRALTPLRPSGSALFGQARVDVVTDGMYVDAGEPLRVIEISGARVVVARITAETASTRKP